MEKKKKWLSPYDVDKLAILPLGIKGIRERMKSGIIPSVVLEGNQLVTTKEEVQSYFDSLPRTGAKC